MKTKVIVVGIVAVGALIGLWLSGEMPEPGTRSGLAGQTLGRADDPVSAPSAALKPMPDVFAETRDDELAGIAAALHQRLTTNWTVASCRDSEPGLARLLADARLSRQFADWTANLAVRCAQLFPTEGVERRDFLRRLVAKRPHPAILSELGMAEFAQGQPEEGIALYRAAMDAEGSSESALRLGMAEAAYAEFLQKTRADEGKRALLLLDAEEAFARSIQLSNGATAAGAYEAMARVKLALGKNDEALAYAEKTLFALQAGLVESDANSVATYYFRVGDLYYKAGQRQTGIAYMDQGISLALGNVREQLASAKALTLEGRL